jgi:hypothetical protein
MNATYEAPHCATSSILLLLHPSSIQIVTRKRNGKMLDWTSFLCAISTTTEYIYGLSVSANGDEL